MESIIEAYKSELFFCATAAMAGNFWYMAKFNPKSFNNQWEHFHYLMHTIAISAIGYGAIGECVYEKVPTSVRHVLPAMFFGYSIYTAHRISFTPPKQGKQNE